MMIFVTVGTHEQQFNRLVKYMDNYKRDNIVERVVIQSGYSTYKCKYAEQYDFISPKEMDKYMQDAELIITHGGPSSFLAALKQNKPVVVVPRMLKYEEHVNNHQVEFLKRLAPQYAGILFPVYDIDTLGTTVKRVLSKHTLVNSVKWHNATFNDELGDIVARMMRSVNVK
ncbi:glycosyltransferase [Lactiplantibacillus pentosus]|uniref:glycosyltransferase n=1 Tax=Lactiplantibacillus pentosus TaxID=1589 RepID=UPI0020A7199A|nr:glycosyltransferase [Lactiplantibacillus pentosus]MDY1545779.1 glycosyltransferase [Lactiplantibacillus pentosus]